MRLPALIIHDTCKISTCSTRTAYPEKNIIHHNIPQYFKYFKTLYNSKTVYSILLKLYKIHYNYTEILYKLKTQYNSIILNTSHNTLYTSHIPYFSTQSSGYPLRLDRHKCSPQADKWTCPQVLKHL